MPPAKEARKPLFIAVPTQDGITIFPGMLGRAKYFYVYSIINGTDFILVEKRVNPYESTMQHLKTLDVYSEIADCQVIVSAVIGKKGIERLKEKGAELYFRKGAIREALISIFHNRSNRP